MSSAKTTMQLDITSGPDRLTISMEPRTAWVRLRGDGDSAHGFLYLNPCDLLKASEAVQAYYRLVGEEGCDDPDAE